MIQINLIFQSAKESLVEEIQAEISGQESRNGALGKRTCHPSLKHTVFI